VVLPDGGGAETASVTTRAYDLNGNLLTLTDANGNGTGTAGDGTTTYSYDRANRLTGIDYSDSTPDVTFTLDNVGNRTAMADGSGTETRDYDNLDRLTEVERGSNTFNYVYDAAGNITRRTYPDSTVIDYTYDPLNRLSSITNGGNTSTYGYNAASHQTTLTLPAGNGYVETRTYDAAGRLITVKSDKGGSVLAEITYTRDNVGNPLTETRTGTSAVSKTFSYDNIDRLTGVCFQAGPCSGGSDPFIRWSYDGVGNRLTEQRPAGTTSYSYDNADRMLTAGANTYTYDRNGNQLTGGGTTFTYDLANRTKTAVQGATTTTYSYDGDGIRLLASTGSGASDKTKFLWDVNYGLAQLALERDGNDSLLRRFAHGLRPLTFATGSGTSYYHYDPLGSVRDITSSTGIIGTTYDYEPYGTIRTQSGTSPNPLRFAGEYHDPTGFIHLRARQYDAELGRFLNRDPASTRAGIIASATYVYANDRPTAIIDPSGMTFVPAMDGRTNAVAIASGIGADHAEYLVSPEPTVRMTLGARADRFGNGCGPNSWKARLIPDSFGPFSFAYACERHDYCYGGMWGTWRLTCDDAFHERMMDECTRLVWNPAELALRVALRDHCSGVAKIYHAAVRSQGQGAFRDGQMKWCPYPRGSIKCWVSITRRDG
jgi:RHS repeat-associated protein